MSVTAQSNVSLQGSAKEAQSSPLFINIWPFLIRFLLWSRYASADEGVPKHRYKARCALLPQGRWRLRMELIKRS